MSVGYHINKVPGPDGTFAKHILATLDEIKARGLNPCAQIFVTGPAKPVQTLGPIDKQTLAARKEKTLVIHGAYIDAPWKHSRNSIANIKTEMQVAAEIGATGVIVHLGASTNDSLEDILAQLVDQPDAILDNAILWLEINHIKPNENSFETPEKLHVLFTRALAAIEGTKLQVGLCVDTAHLHSCGVDLSTYALAKAWFDTLRELLPGMHMMLHLNDSNKVRGCGADNHAPLTTGNIWRAYNPITGALNFDDSGLMAVLLWAEYSCCTTILERGGQVPDADLRLVQAAGFFSV